MTVEGHTIDAAPEPRQSAGSRRTALVAIVVVALAAGGAAFAASKVHSRSSSSAAGGGLGGGFGPAGGMRDGYRFGPRGGGLGDRGPRRGGLTAAADYLGVSPATLFSDVQSGKTLAQVAEATPGKSVQGLIDAIVAAEKTQLTAAVSSGRLTQAQADQLSAQTRNRATNMVNGTFRGPGGDGDHGFRPPGGVTL